MRLPVDDSVLLEVRIPRDLLEALRKAADAAGERRDHAIINRLQSSLAVDDAKRMGKKA